MYHIWPHAGRPVDDEELERLYGYPTGTKWLAANFVSSADGAAEIGGKAARLSNPTDQKVLKLGSDLADVLLVGARTAMVEDFRGVHPGNETEQRRRRHQLSAIAPTAVVTTGYTLPVDAPVVTEAQVPTIVVTCEAAPAHKRRAWKEAGAEVLVSGDTTVDLPAALDALAERGLRRIDCEGGPHLFGSLLAAGMVDELRLTLSPLLVSGTATRIAAGVPLDRVELDAVSILAEDATMLIRYLVKGPSGA